jgi:hypothetical protein
MRNEERAFRIYTDTEYHLKNLGEISRKTE